MIEISLSPLLSNIVLGELDKEVEKRGLEVYGRLQHLCEIAKSGRPGDRKNQLIHQK